MKIKRGKKEVKAIFIIANLIIATFAFSWLVGAQLAGEANLPIINKGDGTETESPTSTAGTSLDEKSQSYANSGTTPSKSKESPAKSVLPAAIGLGTPVTPTGVSSTIKFGNGYNFKGVDKIAYSAKALGDNNWQLLDEKGEVIDGAIVSQDNLVKSGLNPELFKSGFNFNGVPETTELINGNPVSGFLSQDGKGFLTTVDNKIYAQNSKGEWAEVGVSAESTKGSSMLSQFFGATKGTGWDALFTGLQWAGIAYGAGQLIGDMAGLDDQQTQALSYALAAGAGVYKFLATDAGISKEIGTSLWGQAGPGALGYGLIAAAVVFVLMYKEESEEVVTFECKPWQAPVGGSDCEKCNEVAGCSEYRCKSLGQACQLLNEGTGQEKCAWVNPHDVKSPGISPWEDVLTTGYKYTDVRIRPPGDGSEPGRMRIVKEGKADGCVEAFTPLKFGIVTVGPDGEDEPAQCRIDINHTLKFDNMAYWFGDSNLYLYNHTQQMALPSPAAINEVAPELQHDGTYSLFVRCRDANGNENVDEFVIQFCVDKGPDTTPPKIEGTSIRNGMPVKYNQSNVDLEVYVNEPADCKWSREDRTYDNMENTMQCSNKVWEMNNNMVYTCKTTLTGIKDRTENKFYFRCKDQPRAAEGDRNVNMESYPYTLIGTEPLNIIDVKPNGTVKGSTDVISVNIEVETANGYKNGEAVCYYSDTQNEGDYIEFFETGTNKHKQRLDLTEGSYKYYIKCLDLGGNRDDNVSEFTVDVDTESPIIARVYEENALLKIITTEESTCKYSINNCNFLFEDGIDMPYANKTEHVAEWKTENTYYIRCSDLYGNLPVSNTCSMVVRPYDVVEQKVEE